MILAETSFNLNDYSLTEDKTKHYDYNNNILTEVANTRDYS